MLVAAADAGPATDAAAAVLRGLLAADTDRADVAVFACLSRYALHEDRQLAKRMVPGARDAAISCAFQGPDSARWAAAEEQGGGGALKAWRRWASCVR